MPNLAWPSHSASDFLLPPPYSLSMASLRVLTSTITTTSRKHSSFSAARLSIITASRTFLTQNSEFLPSLPKPSFPFVKISAQTKPAWKICGASVATAAAASAPIKVGERLPDATLSYLDNAGNLQTVSVAELAAGKKIVLFAVPGAFTPTCTQKHVPGFIALADDLRARGADVIACVSVNDAFVLKAWANSIGAGDKLLFLSDGNRQFTDAMGVVVDLSDKPAGLGLRSRRYSLLADDGVVKVLNLEEGGAFTVSGAEDILKAL